MGGLLSRFTGSGATLGTLTSSAAINVSTLSNYNITQNADRVASDIKAMTGSLGSEGNSFQKNVNT